MASAFFTSLCRHDCDPAERRNVTDLREMFGCDIYSSLEPGASFLSLGSEGRGKGGGVRDEAGASSDLTVRGTAALSCATRAHFISSPGRQRLSVGEKAACLSDGRKRTTQVKVFVTKSNEGAPRGREDVGRCVNGPARGWRQLPQGPMSDCPTPIDSKTNISSAIFQMLVLGGYLGRDNLISSI
jgi:hypothetical protein